MMTQTVQRFAPKNNVFGLVSHILGIREDFKNKYLIIMKMLNDYWFLCYQASLSTHPPPKKNFFVITVGISETHSLIVNNKN